MTWRIHSIRNGSDTNVTEYTVRGILCVAVNVRNIRMCNFVELVFGRMQNKNGGHATFFILQFLAGNNGSFELGL
jgi:hypothetical protein